MNRLKRSGFSLIELMIVIAITSIIAALAVPSYQDMLERNRLKQAIESLANDLKFARAEAIKRSTNTTLTLTAGWSYSITSAAGTLKTVAGSQFQGISLPYGGKSVFFSFRRGTAGGTGVTLTSAKYKVRVRISDVGRVRICIPDDPTGMTGLPGYPSC